MPEQRFSTEAATRVDALGANHAGEAGARAREQDTWDWTYLCEQLGPTLVRVGVARYGLRVEEAEDLLYGVFERVLVRRPTVRSPAAFVRASFLHACIDHFRHRRRTLAATSTAPVADDPIPRLVAALAVSTGMRRISLPCRGLLEAYCLEEHTLAETAARVGGTVNAVWKRIDRCLQRLLQVLT